MTDTTYYVYVIFNLDGVPIYVGKGKGNRAYDHFKPSSLRKQHHLYSFIKKYGTLPVVIIRDNLTNEQSQEIERALIAALGRIDLGTGNLFNLTEGGEGNSGWHPSQSVRDKIRKKRIEYFKDPKNREQARECAVGYRHTDDARKRMSKAHKGKPPKWSQTPGLREAAIANMRKPRKVRPTEQRIEQMRMEMLECIWITNGVNNRHIRPDATVPDGWRVGRTYHQHQRDAAMERRGKIWITNEVECRLITYDDPIPTGWRRGQPKRPDRQNKIPKWMLDDDKKSSWIRKISKSRLGRRPSWIDDHDAHTKVSDKIRQSKLGKIWINNGKDTKLTNPKEIPDGWVRGMAKSIKKESH